MPKFTLDDFAKHLAHDDFLGDSNYAAGAQTWVETVCEEFGPSAGGLVAAAVRAGLVEHASNEVLELTEKGAALIADIRAS